MPGRTLSTVYWGIAALEATRKRCGTDIPPVVRTGKLPAPLRETSACAPTSFIPVVTTPIPPAEKPGELRLDITLDNGIQADLRGLSRDDVLALLPVLAGLPCSVSTRR